MSEPVQEVWFVTVYQHTWGRGHTPEESRAQARKAGGRGNRWYTKQLPEGAKDPYVDDFASICWAWSEGFEDTDPNSALPLPVVAKGRSVKASELSNYQPL